MTESFQYPSWAEIAFRELLLGVSEIPGHRDNLRILSYFRDTNLEPFDGDETHWCASGLNWVLHVDGIQGTNLANARSFDDWGNMTDERRGAIAVLWRESPDSWKGHVGILVGWSTNTLMLLGGNQGNTWSVRPFPRDRLSSLRWPNIEQRFT